MRNFRQFKSDCKGNVAMMLAIAAVPMLICVGSAVDMVQTNATLAVLQGAADAAAVAAGGANSTDIAEVREVVTKYLTTNGAISALDYVDKIEAKLDKSSRTFSVLITGKRKTSLMYLAGINTMDLNAFSEVRLGGDGLEVALVLDNTGSMSASGRLPALKKASKLLVDEILSVTSSGSYARVGIVPFSSYVNVGLSRRNKPWIAVDADRTEKRNACWNEYPHATSSNCRQVPNIVDGIQQGTTEQCDWDYGKPEEKCSEVTDTFEWHGCVGSRPEPLDESLGSLGTRYQGLMNEWCTSEIVELTDSKSKLHNTIDGFVATGETYIPAGLLWGWNMLDSEEPLDKAKTPKQIKDMGGTKAIVLMTDGQNTLAPYSPIHRGWDGASDWAKGDAKTKTLCENIKADGIVVYTVSFMVTDVGSKALLANCASDASKSYTADSAEDLAAAFKEIGQSMTAMRLSK